jgi:hypothetical protein
MGSCERIKETVDADPNRCGDGSLNARDGTMTQPIGSVAYQTRAKIAADKNASLNWLDCKAHMPRARTRLY